MISLELSSIQYKDAQRAELAQAMAAFTGTIEVVPGVNFKPVGKYAWNRNDITFPNSSQNTASENRDTAMARRIKELVAKGAGITTIKHTLQIDVRRIRRIAEEHGIDIPKAYKANGISSAARQAQADNGARRREGMAPRVAAIAAQGLTIREMAERMGCSKRTIIRILDEFKIERGQRVQS